MSGRAAVLIGVVICPIGCTSSVEVFNDDDPSASCTTDRGDELAALQTSVEALEAMEQRHTSAMAHACANIIGDLTHGAPPPAEALDHQQAEAMCTAAHSMIETSIAQGGELTMVLEDAGGCSAAPSSVCQGSPVVIASCQAQSIFDGPCIEPVVSTTSPDAVLAATFDENFPTILALDISVANHAGDGEDILVEGALMPLGQMVSCEPEANTLTYLAERSATAMENIVDLLTWVRVSVIINGG